VDFCWKQALATINQASNRGTQCQRRPNADTNINFVAPVETHRILHEIARAQDRTVSSLMRGIVSAYLAKHQRIAAAKSGPAKAAQIIS
jgi:hypothetical protein